MAVGVLSTDPFHGYSVVFSPFTGDKLAVVGGLNYGIAGPGGLIVYQIDRQAPPGGIGGNNGGYNQWRRYDWKDVLFDVTWSELHEPVLVVGGGDGGVAIFDQSKPEAGPVSVLPGHTAEVCSVEWSLSRQEQLLLSSSWDRTVRIWDCLQGVGVSVWEGHGDKVYRARWNPRLSNQFASVSGDGTLRLWDVLSPGGACGCVNVGGVEILSCSWNKYNETTLATGSTDNLIRVWDTRQLIRPLLVLAGHTQSVTTVTFDPHTPFVLASSAYDSTVRFWNTDPSLRGRGQPHLQTIAHHKEFTYGVEFSCHERGLVADCSWDKTVKVYTPTCLNRATSTLFPLDLPPS